MLPQQKRIVSRACTRSRERRARADRRRQPNLIRDWRWLFYSRRRRARREEDASRVCLDWFPPQLLVVVLGILVLSAADATLTLRLLDLGLAREANPVMRVLVEQGPALFLNVKLLVTGLCLMFLVAYSNLTVLRGFRIGTITYWIFGCYLGVVVYEAALLLTAPV